MSKVRKYFKKKEMKTLLLLTYLFYSPVALLFLLIQKVLSCSLHRAYWQHLFTKCHQHFVTAVARNEARFDNNNKRTSRNNINGNIFADVSTMRTVHNPFGKNLDFYLFSTKTLSNKRILLLNEAVLVEFGFFV